MSQQILRTTACQLLPAVIVTLFLATGASAFQMAAPPSVQLSRMKLELQEKKEQFERFSKNWERVNSKLGEFNRRLDSLNISRASFDEVVTVLQTQRINLKIELAGLEARQKAAQSLGSGKSVTTKANQKRLELLKEKVELCRKEHENIRKLALSGHNSKKSLDRAKFAALVAETDLAEFEAEYSTNSQAPRITNMLIDVALTKAERTAQLEMVDQLLKQFVGEREVLEQLDLAKNSAKRAMENLVRGEQEWRNVKSKYERLKKAKAESKGDN